MYFTVIGGYNTNLNYQAPVQGHSYAAQPANFCKASNNSNLVPTSLKTEPKLEVQRELNKVLRKELLRELQREQKGKALKKALKRAPRRSPKRAPISFNQVS